VNTKTLILEVVNEQLERGKPTINENMVVVPLLAKQVTKPDYLLLQEAIEQGLAEVKEGGSVSELILVNRGEKPVLIVQGQELISGSQHRQANATILGPKGETTIPVSCIEAGRGLSMGAFFTVGNITLPSIRTVTSYSVSDSVKLGQGYKARQDEVWGDITQALMQHRVESLTSDHSAIYKQLSRDWNFQKFKSKFIHGDNQCGDIILINDEPVALEVFDSPDTWHTLHESIINAYAAHAYASRDKKQIDEAQLEQKLVDLALKLAELEVSTHPGTGLGQNSRLKMLGYTGEALTREEKLIHLVLMKTKEPSPTRREPDRRWADRVSAPRFRRQLYQTL